MAYFTQLTLKKFNILKIVKHWWYVRLACFRMKKVEQSLAVFVFLLSRKLYSERTSANRLVSIRRYRSYSTGAKSRSFVLSLLAVSQLAYGSMSP